MADAPLFFFFKFQTRIGSGVRLCQKGQNLVDVTGALPWRRKTNAGYEAVLFQAQHDYSEQKRVVPAGISGLLTHLEAKSKPCETFLIQNNTEHDHLLKKYRTANMQANRRHFNFISQVLCKKEIRLKVHFYCFTFV